MCPWISYANKKPKGPFKPVFDLDKPQKALGALMVYTEYMHKEASPSQIEKFTNAVSSIDSSEKIQESQKIQFDKAVSSLGTLPRGRFHKLSSWSEKSVRVPAVKRRGRYENVVYGTTMSLEAIMNTSSHPLATSYFEENVKHLPDELYRLYSGSAFSPNDFTGLDGIVGKIGFIQEPGLKLRTVANPFPIFQILLSRLGSSLYSLLATIPEDSTFDQNKSIVEIQKEIRQGRKLMSIDLSSATDRFPLHFTLSVLRDLGCNESDLRLFEDISRSNWNLPGGKVIKWQTGQPLGVYPSFAAFALSHHVLVRMASPKFYRILGDDMIVDYETGIRLRELYQALGLVISEDKSLSSNLLGEFGGRLITSDSILIQPKWRDLSDRSFIDLIRGLGPKGVSLLKPRQRKMVKLLAEIPETVCSYGLNWNPEGKSFDTRVAENQQIIDLLSSLDTFDIENENAKQSYAIGQKMVLDQHSDFRVPLESTANSKTQIESLEQRIISEFGITKLSVLSSIEGWHMSRKVSISDPRGSSTLDILERKLKELK
jgi:hypothetical protein